MVTIFGATGYTGRRLAHAAARRGLPLRLAGRSAEKLHALAASLPASPSVVVADAAAPESLRALFPGTRVLANCAGPFSDLGEAVARLAATHGVHYLDITNELAYVYGLRQYAALARQTGAALVPACAFEVAIADCLAAWGARGLPGPVEAVDVVYALPGRVVSHGTRQSALRTFATSWLTYREGRWQTRLPGGPIRRGQIGARPYHALAFPSSEVATVPAHLPARQVQAWLALSRRWAGLVSAVLPLVSVLLRSPLGWLTALSFRYLMPPPPEATPARARFAVQVELTHAAGQRVVAARGSDPYGLTAEIAAYAAQQFLAADFRAAGVLAPAQALDPEAFLQWLGTQGVEVTAAG